MSRRLVCLVVSLLAAPTILLTPYGATAQSVGTPVSSTPQRTTAVDASMFERTFSADLEQVSIRDALAAISSKTGVRFAYVAQWLPKDKRVTVVGKNMTVRDALNIVLAETGLDAVASPTGAIRLVPGAAPAAERPLQQGTGAISGVIRDSATGASVPDVEIRVDGTTLQTKSGSDGRYKITGVAAGEYRLTARRVGYIAHTRTVTVGDGENKTLNFDLNLPATKLDEVVTTALGEQRRYQVGNVISTINLDSIAPTAPVTNVTDLISARAPGVEVVETGGLTGSGQAIRIRGQSSLVLQGDPIVIVDGVREDNAPGGTRAMPVCCITPTPNRLNDLDFSDIETIDVLKGPAASTEYGTDAANGVIVITTKHGASGRPLWHADGEQTESAIPVKFPEYYYAWGHATDGTAGSDQCALLPLYDGTLAFYGSPYNIGSTFGTCVVDSMTHFNPLNHARYSIFGNGDRGKYDLSVNGGSDALRYFVSGGLTNETGIVHVPSVFLPAAQSVGFPESALKPNAENQRSIRATTTVHVSQEADFAISAAYLSTFQTTPIPEQLSTGPGYGPTLPDAAHAYGYSEIWLSPLAELGDYGTQQTDRLTSGLTANWRPSSWLNAHATFGLDHGSQQVQNTLLPQALEYADNLHFGEGSVTNGGSDIYSMDLRASVTASITTQLRAVTSVGLQMVDSRTNGLTASSGNIASTTLTLNGINNAYVIQTQDRSATLGGYVEEQLGLANRLFVTGALRVDDGSGFGRSYSSTAYPKASVSWLALDLRDLTLRLRGALGAAGAQPTNGAALELYTAGSAWSGGAPITVANVANPGNPDLRPERATEYEGGMDIGLWGNRVSIELTGYSKTTQDALYNQTLGFDVGSISYQVNLGEIRNTGFEGTVNATIVQSREIAWTTTFNASVNGNKLVHLAPGIVGPQDAGDYIQRQAAGYPLYGFWGTPVSYSDLNHDGIIEPNEETTGDSTVYVGSSLPTREASFATYIGLWRNAVAISGLFDYRGGYRVFNYNVNQDGIANTLEEQNVPSAPLWLQARSTSLGLASGYPAGLIENGTFLRFRELSVTYAVPMHWARAIRTQYITVTGAVRNLALWTRFTGADPEVSDPGSGFTPYSSTTQSYELNNDLRSSTGGAIPLPRYVVVRLNVGF